MPEKEDTPAPEPEAPKTKAPTKPEDAGEDFRYIVRFANTDLDGTRHVVYALQQVKGVGSRIAEAVVSMAGVPRRERVGNLDEKKTEEMEAILAELTEKVPSWMLNRQHDPESGQDLHQFGPQLDVQLRDDINRMRMIRSYRGVRHETGQKVRGQRTRSNGRTGLTVGVMKKAAIQAAQAKAKEGGEEKKE